MTDITMRYALEATLSDGQAYKTYTGKQRKMSRLLRVLNWQTCHLTVTYLRGKQPLGTNEGDYATREAALLAWEAFIDPEVLTFIGGAT